MLRITAQQLGKRFNRDWIFKGFNYTFEQGQAYAITGNNGSGKSTLLQVLAGSMELSEGTLTVNDDTHTISTETLNQHLTIVAPYLELIEEMTATEMLQFHFQFKPQLPHHSIAQIIDAVQLSHAAHKQIRYYSSGMKQRIKLAQAFFAHVPILMLDEPCSNLDRTGYELYQQLIATYAREKLILVCSNEAEEYQFCNQVIAMAQYK